MAKTNVSQTNENGLRRRAKELGIDVSKIIDDLKGRMSLHNNQGEYLQIVKE